MLDSTGLLNVIRDRIILSKLFCHIKSLEQVIAGMLLYPNGCDYQEDSVGIPNSMQSGREQHRDLVLSLDWSSCKVPRT